MQRSRLYMVLISGVFLLSGCSLLGIGHRDEQELRAAYQNEFSRTMQVRGLDLHYRVEGSGEPIVLIHGVLSSLHTWDAWTEELKKNYTVYRIDLPGFGFSDMSEGLYNESSLSPFVDELLEELGLNEVHLVGNSLGGFIAWTYALNRPERVKSLTVIDTLSYKQKLPGILKFVANPVVRPFARHMVPKPLFSHGVNQVYADPKKIPKQTKDRYLDLLMRKGNKDNFINILMQLREQSENPNIGEGIKRIAVPTLVMWGKQDNWIPVAMAYRWKEELPSAKIIVYPEAGHVPMEESPVVTVRDFQEFLQQLGDK